MTINEKSKDIAILRTLGFREKDITQIFFLQGMINALSYGAPPHGGIAPGIDRLAMILLGRESIRDVIAFPKTQSQIDPLFESPSSVDAGQLDDLGIKIVK